MKKTKMGSFMKHRV